MENLETRLTRIAKDFARQIMVEMGQAFAEQVTAFASQTSDETPSPPSLRPALQESTPSIEKVPKKRDNPPHCIFPGCAAKHQGPRSRFFCAFHGGTKDEDKKRYKAAWDASKIKG